MKIYVKSTLRDAEDTEKMDFPKNHVCLVPATGPSQLNSCGARIVRMGGGRISDSATSLRHLATCQPLLTVAFTRRMAAIHNTLSQGSFPDNPGAAAQAAKGPPYTRGQIRWKVWKLESFFER